jgi:hypothetical protein
LAHLFEPQKNKNNNIKKKKKKKKKKQIQKPRFLPLLQFSPPPNRTLERIFTHKRRNKRKNIKNSPEAIAD